MIRTRWAKEFLPGWNMRNKWNEIDMRLLKLNDLVWVRDGNVKQSNYKMQDSPCVLFT